MFLERILSYCSCLCSGTLFCFQIVLQKYSGVVVDVSSAAMFRCDSFKDDQGRCRGKIIITDSNGDIVIEDEDMLRSGGLKAGKRVGGKVQVLADERGRINA